MRKRANRMSADIGRELRSQLKIFKLRRILRASGQKFGLINNISKEILEINTVKH